MQAFKLLIQYDGTRYRGWQRQTGTDQTIQGKLEAVLSRSLGVPVQIQGSGRTDAGVHALGQVASFQAETNLEADQILALCRAYLPEDIGVVWVKPASPRFHARLNATGKTYRYRVWNSDEPCIFQRRYVYSFPDPLDLPRMEQAAKLLLGRHDFLGFSADKVGKKSTVRTITAIDIHRDGPEVVFTYSGDGFLRQMVRILTGTLLEIGRGEREAQSVLQILQTGIRADAGFTVPAKGLCLMEVRYD